MLATSSEVIGYHIRHLMTGVKLTDEKLVAVLMQTTEVSMTLTERLLVWYLTDTMAYLLSFWHKVIYDENRGAIGLINYAVHIQNQLYDQPFVRCTTKKHQSSICLAMPHNQCIGYEALCLGNPNMQTSLCHHDIYGWSGTKLSATTMLTWLWSKHYI